MSKIKYKSGKIILQKIGALFKNYPKEPFCFHVFLFAIYPILFLYSHNIVELYAIEIIMPMLAILGFAIYSLIVLNRWLGDIYRSGIMVTMFLILFFSFGHSVDLIINFRLNLGLFSLGAAEIVCIVYAVIFILGIRYLLRTKKNLKNITNYLNIAAGLLIVISLYNIISYEIKGVTLSENVEKKDSEKVTAKDIDPTNLPDVYYIILDGYGRSDILKKMYGYDNSKFTNNLKEQGFYVAPKARSNYCQTQLSLASSMNIDYLDNLTNQWKDLGKLINSGKVIKTFKANNYQTVAFSTGYTATEITNADIYFKTRGALSEFENILINTTPIRLVMEQSEDISQYDLHRRQVINTLDSLPRIAKIKNPTFTFAHVVMPHPPFVFDENGKEIDPKRSFAFSDGNHLVQRPNNKRNAGKLTPEEYREKYKKQLIFISDKIKTIIERIIDKSEKPPIIILQADHGPGSMLDWHSAENTNFTERLSILNAYYLPGVKKGLYKNITPVNTFRFIFNKYFGINYKLLKDKSYYSTKSEPFVYIDIDK